MIKKNISLSIISLSIITVGFLLGTLATVIHKAGVTWLLYAVGLVVGVVGVVLVKVTTQKEATSKEVLSKNINSITTSLTNIVQNLQVLKETKQNIFTYEIRHKIDDMFPADIETFVNARQSITHTLGNQAYAEIMSLFAAGERYLNRVWSASAEGYIDEVNLYIDKSYEQFNQSLKKLKSYENTKPAN